MDFVNKGIFNVNSGSGSAITVLLFVDCREVVRLVSHLHLKKPGYQWAIGCLM